MIRILLLRLLTALCKRSKHKETNVVVITIINVHQDKDESDNDKPSTSS